MPEPRFTNRLVFLHGFTQTHHHWHAGARSIATAIATDPSLAFVDLPGHGLSSDDRSDIVRAAASLPALAGAGTWVGYSMGGRHALLAALTQPPEIERLVLIGATPGIEAAAERAVRAELDAQRADRVEQIGVDSFLTEWLEAPMFDQLPRDPAGFAHRRRNTAPGLAHSLRTGGTGVQPAVWDRLADVGVPTLVLAGDSDLTFTAIGRSMAEHLPEATFITIPGAGHAAHTERPAAVATTVADWLSSTD